MPARQVSSIGSRDGARVERATGGVYHHLMPVIGRALSLLARTRVPIVAADRFAARQPEEQWKFRAADCQAHHYQARLRA